MIEHKGYVVYKVNNLAMYAVREPNSGGSVPDVLKGLFTSSGFAITAINQYLNSKNKKVDKDDGRVDTSRD